MTDAGWYGAGEYWTSQYSTALFYAHHDPDGVQEAELQFENPLFLTYAEADTLAAEYGTKDPAIPYWDRHASAQRLSSDLAEQGYDGLVIEDGRQILVLPKPQGSANSCREGLDEERSWDQKRLQGDFRKGGFDHNWLPNSLYERNGIMFWNKYAVQLRDSIEDKIVLAMQEAIWEFYGDKFNGNPGELWRWHQIDAPILTPDGLVSEQYDRNRMYGTRDDLVLRPQTTPGSFKYARTKIENNYRSDSWWPFVVWQHGKSFRREQTKTRKHQRLKEFYQLEIQLFDRPCRFTNQAEMMKVIQGLKKAIQFFVGRCKVVDAKAPSYAEWTKDIVLSKTGMELASISLRNDFNLRHNADVRDPSRGSEIVCLEFAIGTDRVVMNTKKAVEIKVSNEAWEKREEEDRPGTRAWERRRRKERDASK